MKKPGVLERLTPNGRLRSRLVAIEEKVRARALGRMDAGDLIQEEVVKSLAAAERPEDHLLRFEAQLLRARFYLESEGATPVETAEAILDAAEHERALTPRDPERVARVADLARAVVPDLHATGSRRTLGKLLATLLRATTEAGLRLTTLGTELHTLPHLVRELRDLDETDVVYEILAAASALEGHPTAKATLRRLRQEAFHLYLRTGRLEEALELASVQDLLGVPDRLALALRLADASRTDARARRVYEDVLRGDPTTRSRLEMSLRHAASVSPKTRLEDLEAKEALTTLLLRIFGPTEWTFHNLAMLGVQRGDDELVVAAFAALSDLGGETMVLAEFGAASLVALGWERLAHRVAAQPGPPNDDEPAEPLRTLARARIAISRRHRAESDVLLLLGAISRLLRDRQLRPDLAKGLVAAKGRLLKTIGRNHEAILALDQAVRGAPEDEGLVLDLAEVCLEDRDVSRARALLVALPSRRDAVRAAFVEATLRVEEQRPDSGLEALEAVLAAPEALNAVAERRRTTLERIRRRLANLGLGSPSRFLASLETEATRFFATSARIRLERRLRLRAADLARAARLPEREAIHLLPLARRRGAGRGLVFRTAEASLRAGDVGLAFELLDPLKDAAFGHAEFHALFGLVHLAREGLETAREHLELAVETGDRRPVVLLGLAQSALALEDADAALALLRDAPELTRLAVESPARVLASALEAAALERLGRFDEALAKHAPLAESGGTTSKAAFGRLAIELGAVHAASDAKTSRELYVRGLAALEGCDDATSRALRGQARAALDQDVISAGEALLEAAVRETRVGGDPVRLSELLSEAKRLLPPDLDAVLHVDVALSRLGVTRDRPSLANLSALLARSGADEDVLAVAEAIAAVDTSAVAAHHLALVATRLALDADREGRVEGVRFFERAHAAWAAWRSAPHAASAPPAAETVPEEALFEAYATLARTLREYHGRRVDETIAVDPRLALAHARLATRSPMGPADAAAETAFTDRLFRILDHDPAADAAATALEILEARPGTDLEVLRRRLAHEAHALRGLLASPEVRTLAANAAAMVESLRRSASAADHLSRADGVDGETLRQLATRELARACVATWHAPDAEAARQARAAAIALFSAVPDGPAPHESLLFEVLEDADATVDPGVVVEALLAAGDFETAERRAGRIFATAQGQGDHERARAAITVLNDVREARQRDRAAFVLRGASHAFEARHYREVLDIVPDRRVDPRVAPEATVLRLRALARLRRASQALGELEEIAKLRHLDRAGGIDVDGLKRELAAALAADEEERRRRAARGQDPEDGS